MGAVLGSQVGRASKHTAKGDILTKHTRRRVGSQHHVHGRRDGRAHVHLGELLGAQASDGRRVREDRHATDGVRSHLLLLLLNLR